VSLTCLHLLSFTQKSRETFFLTYPCRFTHVLCAMALFWRGTDGGCPLCTAVGIGVPNGNIQLLRFLVNSVLFFTASLLPVWYIIGITLMCLAINCLTLIFLAA
jgi:hypothetical protein